jgi:prepilin signal peptidase PulO-like enzyme (type II secretory pathway)
MSIAVVGASRTAVKNGFAIRFTRKAGIIALAAGVCLQVVVAVAAPGVSAVMLEVAIAAVTVCAVTDAQTGYVFDGVTLSTLCILILLAAAHGSLLAGIAGICACAGALSTLHIVTRGRGLGLGDVKLSACIGAALGATDALISLGVAFVIGGTYAAYLLVTCRAQRGDALHFAPYLACGMAAILLYRSIT